MSTDDLWQGTPRVLYDSRHGAPVVVFVQWCNRWVSGPGPRTLCGIQQAPGE